MTSADFARAITPYQHRRGVKVGSDNAKFNYQVGVEVALIIGKKVRLRPRIFISVCSPVNEGVLSEMGSACT